MDENEDDWNIDNLPNRLTLFRIILIPIILGMLYAAKFTNSAENELFYGVIAAWCFVAAAITDFLDGYIARKRNIITVFGSFLDPIADKFLVISSLIMLLSLARLPDWIVLVLVLREMYMTSLRLLASSHKLQVPVSGLGKWKTTAQMVGIPMLMVGGPWLGLPFVFIAKIFIYAASLLSLTSALIYSGNLLKRLKSKRKEARLERKKKKAARKSLRL